MHERIADPNEFLFTVLCLGIGGSLLALAGIWLEMRRGYRARRVFSGVLSAVLCALAAILWGADQPIGVVGPVLALGVACFAAYAMQAALVRRWANRMLEPWGIWTTLLVVSPIFAAVYAHYISQPVGLPAVLIEPVPEIRKQANAPRAVTDLGREIEMFRYDEVKSLEAVEASLLELERFTHEVIRLEGPNSVCNCHGWVFTGGTYGVQSKDVDTILADNSYEPVQPAQAGDLVVYRDDSGSALHTGLVRFVGDDGILLVESKWGPLGVFLHAPETQPYGQQFGFWRSPRQGHRLHLSPAVTTNGKP